MKQNEYWRDRARRRADVVGVLALVAWVALTVGVVCATLALLRGGS